jgi:hypothetical protein
MEKTLHPASVLFWLPESFRFARIAMQLTVARNRLPVRYPPTGHLLSENDPPPTVGPLRTRISPRDSLSVGCVRGDSFKVQRSGFRTGDFPASFPTRFRASAMTFSSGLPNVVCENAHETCTPASN